MSPAIINVVVRARILEDQIFLGAAGGGGESQDMAWLFPEKLKGFGRDSFFSLFLSLPKKG